MTHDPQGIIHSIVGAPIVGMASTGGGLQARRR
jgi:hypothetical protein